VVHNYEYGTIGRITTTGKLTTFNGVNVLAGPKGIAVGPDGAMWFANWAGSSIGRITTTVTPKIGSFSPTSGPAGTTVTITGQNLSGATKVAFNGTSATIVSDTATQIVTEVPAGATTGHISVTTSAGTATSTAAFTVT
jgi:IPT/TIG domain